MVGCQRGGRPQQGGTLFSPRCCNGPCVDEIWGWDSWWDSRLEHSGDDSGSNLVSVKRSITLGPRAMRHTNREHQEGRSHTVEHRHRVRADNHTTHITAAVPWQTRATDENAIRNSDRLWERDGA